MRWIYLVVVALAGCSPMIGAGAGFFGLMLLAGVAFLSLNRAAAEPGASETSRATGAPAPRPKCDGWEHKSCHNGRVQTSCCPKNAKCNFRSQPFVDCGYGQCVTGGDQGACPAREPMTVEHKTKEACEEGHGQWAKACVKNVVSMACIAPMHTNYMGPPLNPHFRECGQNRCTTSRYIEDCYASKTDVAVCLTGWTKVCIEGQVVEKCMTPGAKKTEATTGFVKCDGPPPIKAGDRCAVGKVAADACRR